MLVEAGPSDYNDERVLQLREWLSLLGGELDYDYRTTEQPMGIYPFPGVRKFSPNPLQATPTSATPGQKFWAVAARTTLSSRTGPSNGIWTSG